MGSIHHIYRKKEFKPLGPKAEDFIDFEINKDIKLEQLNNQHNIEEIK